MNSGQPCTERAKCVVKRVKNVCGSSCYCGRCMSADMGARVSREPFSFPSIGRSFKFLLGFFFFCLVPTPRRVKRKRPAAAAAAAAAANVCNCGGCGILYARLPDTNSRPLVDLLFNRRACTSDFLLKPPAHTWADIIFIRRLLFDQLSLFWPRPFNNSHIQAIEKLVATCTLWS